MPNLLRKGFRINYNLEALRGFSALFVIVTHISYHHIYFNRSYSPNFLSAVEPNGHLRVLIFFTLSGYVIGISNKSALTSNNIIPYIKKRAIRIYPIYIISIIITLLVATNSYSIATILGNFLFLQPAFVKVIWENNPIWSLNYEVLYYILFIPISYFNISPIIILILSTSIGILNIIFFNSIHIPIISAYAFGFCFWILGLWISRYYTKEGRMSFQMMVSNIFLILSLAYNHPLNTVFDVMTVKIFRLPSFPNSVDWASTMIRFNDLAYLPYCILFILNFTSKDYKNKKYINLIFQILPLLAIPFIIKKSLTEHVLMKSIVSTIFYLISLLLFFISSNKLEVFSKKIIQYGIKIGGISYGLYIIHFPILYLFGRFQILQHIVFDYYIKLITFFIITVLMSYLLEKKYQKFIKKYIY